jgi:hypothetical protein
LTEQSLRCRRQGWILIRPSLLVLLRCGRVAVRNDSTPVGGACQARTT